MGLVEMAVHFVSGHLHGWQICNFPPPTTLLVRSTLCLKPLMFFFDSEVSQRRFSNSVVSRRHFIRSSREAGRAEALHARRNRAVWISSEALRPLLTNALRARPLCGGCRGRENGITCDVKHLGTSSLGALRALGHRAPEALHPK